MTEDSIPHPQGELTLKIQADNRSLNAMGDVFAGWVAMNLDQAGETRARQETENARIVTVSIGSMSFIRPVQLGDLIGFYTQVTETGNTSIKIAVEAWIENYPFRRKLTETTMTFVAVNRGGRTTRINKRTSDSGVF